MNIFGFFYSLVYLASFIRYSNSLSLWKNYTAFDYGTFLLGFIFIICLAQTVFHFCKKKYSRLAFSIFFISLYYIGYIFFHRTNTAYDYAILIDNIGEVLIPENGAIFGQIYRVKDVVTLLFIHLIIIVTFFKSKKFEVSYRRPLLGLASLIVYIILVIFAPYSKEELSAFAKTMSDYYLNSSSKHIGEAYKNIDSILNYQFESTHPEDKKDIILVHLESYSGIYINKKINDKYVTPVMNELYKEGLSFKHFYSNSIQTIKGQYATLCSLVPLPRGKASYRVDSSKLDCLPRVLGQMGYTTYFHDSFGNPGFDNTHDFIKKSGFEYIKTSREIESKPGVLKWGWGVQDDFSYRYFVENIEEFKLNKKPIFAMIQTVSNHMWFDRVPKDQKEIFPDEKHLTEAFINSLHASDKYLGTLINELKEKKIFDNSIIIITGDHSFPNSEHGMKSNAAGAYEEFFRVPLLIISKSQNLDGNIESINGSQVDIKPTVLDLIGYKGEVQSAGETLLTKSERSSYLVQPYNGTFLSVVKHPYKVIWNKRNNRWQYFNLELDPEERSPIKKENKEIKALKKEIGFIFANEEYATQFTPKED